ncbi:MAG TPA: chemotaxis protein CheA [bacterium]|nr:chemotaxis protein CheA [bacterium]
MEEIERDIKDIFVREAFELLQGVEESLLNIEGMIDDQSDKQRYQEDINNIFRAMHTIKGSAGAIGADYIQNFTHNLESFLDKVRESEIILNGDILNLFFKIRDHMVELIKYLDSDMEDFLEFKSESNLLLNGLTFTKNADLIKNVKVESKSEDTNKDEALSEYWHISIRFKENTFIDGMDPFSFIYYLNKIGTIKNSYPISDNIPSFDELNPELCYLGFEINLETDLGREEIIDVFEFVTDDCDIYILPPKFKLVEYMNLIKELPEDEVRLGEILVASGALTKTELERALRIQIEKEKGDDKNLLGENNAMDKNVINGVIEKQEKIKKKKGKESKTFRIDADKLDFVVNIAGELVTVTTGIAELSKTISNSMLEEYTSMLIRLVNDLRDGSIELRMVPVEEVFNRIRRIVRDIGKDLGKIITLEVKGADTEFDRTYMEKIVDPLIHLIRNAIDHGIEMPDERIAKGKPENGKITLNAYNDSGSIVIEVRDDGNGLNKEKILKKALEKGLIDEDLDNLTDSKIYNLIFEPGFSTADEVTNISGRGVGMDIVKRNIADLRGIIEIKTKESEYTAIELRLPLTLAIVDGFMVGYDGNKYVIPLELILECIDYNESDKTNDEVDCINLRGKLLPYIKFSDIFGRQKEEISENNIIVVKCAGQVVGFAVDKIFGEIQTVLKPMGKIYKEAKFFSGATILGNGSIAFVLDIPKIIKHAELKNI